jgi:Aminoglycoside-2''-adenylyltransferase
MATFRPTWCLCGGWAVDAWVGDQRRDHKDVDIAIFQEDQRAIFDHLAGWQLVGHDRHVADNTSELWDGRRRLDLPAHIHARHGDGVLPSRLDGAAEQGFSLEIVLNERANGYWILSRELDIALPIGQCIRESPWGLPTLVPEVVLFYKATAYFKGPESLRPEDEITSRLFCPSLAKRSVAGSLRASRCSTPVTRGLRRSLPPVLAVSALR